MLPDLPPPTYSYARWRIEFLRLRADIMRNQHATDCAAKLDAEADEIERRLERQVAQQN